MKSTKRAFTLIELLVVIAIIAILAAILFPVFAQAKQAAKGAASLSNVKQIGTASFIYSSDADDVFVSQFAGAANSYGWQQSWIMTTLPYMKSYDILKDPNDTTKLTTAFNSGPKFSYVANGILAGDCSATFTWKFRGVISRNGQDWYENGTRSQTQINRVAETVLFATRPSTVDNTDHAANLGKMEGVFGAYESVLDGTSSIDIKDGKGTLPGQSNGQFAAPVATYKGFISRAYAGRSPVTYTDGHAKSMNPEQTVDMGGGIADGNAGGCLQKRYLNQWDALRD